MYTVLFQSTFVILCSTQFHSFHPLPSFFLLLGGRGFNQILKNVFFITKNVNCREISIKNLVTFKRWNEVKDENFEPPFTEKPDF